MCAIFHNQNLILLAEMGQPFIYDYTKRNFSTVVSHGLYAGQEDIC